MELSVVIPCFNEEESLNEAYRRIKAACENVHVRDYEIIFVNDGSTDGTLSIMRSLCETDPSVVAVDLSRNFGHEAASTAGLTHSRGDYIFILDADLQDPPELLGPMMERARAGAEVVYGQRARRAGEPKIKLLLSSSFYHLLSWLSDVPIPRDTGDFRLISRRVADHFLAMPEQQRFVRGMISWIGFKQEPVLYNRDARFAGVTKYNFLKLVKLAFDAISGFSIRPLRISLLFAMFGAALAILLGLYAFISYFFYQTISGWTSLATIITFFSSLQLICIGVVGEYIGRIYIQVKDRPVFIVRDIYRRSERVD
jgi:dolichol-phosphate mannosyltransferase